MGQLCSGRQLQPLNAEMTGNDNSLTLSTLPPEVQHLILPHLDARSLFRLLLTCRQYQHLVSSDCHHLWLLHHNERWYHGKLFPRRHRDERMEWSRNNGWNAHRRSGPSIHDVEVEGKWFDEYLYRSQLDMKASKWMVKLISGSVEEKRQNLINLLREGEDVADIVRDFNNIFFMIDSGHYQAYEYWKFLHDSTETKIEDGSIAVASFFVSKQVDEDFAYFLDKDVDRLKERMATRFGQQSNTSTPYPIRDILVQMGYLFGATAPIAEDAVEYPLLGNRNDYYNPANSLIHDVIGETRRGIPITLAVIYIAIVREAFGIELDVIGLPGHIIVGVPAHLGGGQIFVDPFNFGRILNYDDCREIVERYNITFHDQMVEPISHVEVWQRIIRNLIHALTMDNEFCNWEVATLLTTFLLDQMQQVSNSDDLLNNTGEWTYKSI